MRKTIFVVFSIMAATAMFASTVLIGIQNASATINFQCSDQNPHDKTKEFQTPGAD